MAGNVIEQNSIDQLLIRMSFSICIFKGIFVFENQTVMNLKQLFLSVFFCFITSLLWAKPDLREGDIIFTSGGSEFGKALQLATHSPYTHVGIVLKRNNQLYVLEAAQSVAYTPVNEFISRDSKYVVKRLKNPELLTPQILTRMEKLGETYKGKNYDYGFLWTDEELYCSELVWKIYKSAAGITLGEPKKLREYDLKYPEVQKQIKEKYNGVIPMEEPMVAPGTIFESQLLEIIIH